MLNLSGSFVPLAAAFTDDCASLSEVRIARQVRFWVERSSSGFFLCGETGEFLTTSTSERKLQLETVYRESQGTLPIVVNVSSLNTATSLDLGQHAARHGAAAAFLAPPFFGTYTVDEIDRHIKTVATLSGLPIIVGDPYSQHDVTNLPGLATLGQVAFADCHGCDDWTCDDLSVSLETTLKMISGGPLSSEARKKLETWGSAAVYKALCERTGLELGPIRSPKTMPTAADMNAVFGAAA